MQIGKQQMAAAGGQDQKQITEGKYAETETAFRGKGDEPACELDDGF